MTTLPVTKCGGCGMKRTVPSTATFTSCPHCGSSMLVTNYPIVVGHAPILPETVTVTWPA